MTKTTNAVNTKVISMLLLVAIAAGNIFILPKAASAQILGTGPLPVWCVPWDFNCFKEGILKPVAKSIMKAMIHQLRAATVNWIITGDFEIKKPYFITSFIADPQRIAENVSRVFLSQVTGINFCNFHPSARSIQALVIPINDLLPSFACSVNLGSNQRPMNTIGGALASTRPSANLSTMLYRIRAEQENAIQRQLSATAEEVRTGGGFLGQRDPKTGKIKTPGNLIAETIAGAQLSEMVGQEVNNDIFNAITDVIDTAIGKTIQDGILGNF